VRLGSEAALMFPASFALLFILGASTDLSALQIPYIRAVIFACVLWLAAAVNIAYSKRFFISVCLAAAPAFALGAWAMERMPPLGSPAYYLAGLSAAMILLLACGVGLGLSAGGYARPVWQRLRRAKPPALPVPA
jgi:hydrogenase/urease accessory protein HupE